MLETLHRSLAVQEAGKATIVASGAAGPAAAAGAEGKTYGFGGEAEAVRVGQLLRRDPPPDVRVKRHTAPDEEQTVLPWTTLLRPGVAKVMDTLERRAAEGFAKGGRALVIDGERGVGKSVAVAQLALWARAQGWLVLALDAGAMTRGGRITAAEGAALAQLAVQLPSAVPMNQPLASTPATLLDLVQIGAKSEENSTPVLEWLRSELALVTRVPVLLLVDNVNAFHNPSAYYDMDSSSFAPVFLPPARLVGPRLFLDHTRQFFLRGTTVVATTREGGVTARTFEQFCDERKPRDHRVLQRLTLAEQETLLREWHSSQQLTRPLSPVSRRYVYALTGGIPGELRTVAQYL